MIQRFRHIVHLIIAFFSDYLSLLGRPLFYQLQYQHFRKEIIPKDCDKQLCILGNGPSFSLVTDHLDEMKDIDFCAVNLSVNTEVFFRMKPKMYVIVDMGFWIDKSDERFLQAKKNISKIDWDMRIMLPFNCPNSFKKELERNPFVKVCRYANNSWNPELKKANYLKMRLFKNGLVSPDGSNVSISAVYVGLLLGYKQISLIGTELSWMKDIKVNDKNEVVLVDRHYYGDVEHVWLDYNGNSIKLVDFLGSQLTTFTGHMELRQFADYLGSRIINRTPGSYIDAYERGKFEELLNIESL